MYCFRLGETQKRDTGIERDLEREREREREREKEREVGSESSLS